MIFMIGCGQLDSSNGAWTHRFFVANELSTGEERRIIEEWFPFMQRVCDKAGVDVKDARLFHWSPAETCFLTETYNSAVTKSL
jgi:hypothetical protein